jgi:hypothetical protein
MDDVGRISDSTVVFDHENDRSFLSTVLSEMRSLMEELDQVVETEREFNSFDHSVVALVGMRSDIYDRMRTLSASFPVELSCKVRYCDEWNRCIAAKES